MMHSLQLISPRPALNLRRRPILNKSALGRVIAAWLVLMAGDADAAPAFAISMSAPRWDAPGGTGFERREGFPDGLMTLQSGIAVLQNTEFSNGAIELDMKALAFADTGIQFRRKDRDSSEFVYLRADPDCPAANDCIQYAPITQIVSAHSGARSRRVNHSVTRVKCTGSVDCGWTMAPLGGWGVRTISVSDGNSMLN